MALVREDMKRRLRAIGAKPAAKPDTKLVAADRKTTPAKGRLRSFAESLRFGFGSKTPTISLPQATPVQTDEHAVAPVVAMPKYPSADYIVRTSLSGQADSASNLRGLIDCYNQSHTGWRHKGKE
jgi:hypothetical protein